MFFMWRKLFMWKNVYPWRKQFICGENVFFFMWRKCFYMEKTFLHGENVLTWWKCLQPGKIVFLVAENLCGEYVLFVENIFWLAENISSTEKMFYQQRKCFITWNVCYMEKTFFMWRKFYPQMKWASFSHGENVLSVEIFFYMENFFHSRENAFMFSTWEKCFSREFFLWLTVTAIR